MAFHFLFTIVAILAFTSPLFIFAYDPSPLDDFCVAVSDSSAAGKSIHDIYLYIDGLSRTYILLRYLKLIIFNLFKSYKLF